MIYIYTTKGGFETNEEMVCVELFFERLPQDLAYCEDLVYGELTRSETALMRPNELVADGLHSLTQDSRVLLRGGLRRLIRQFSF